MTGKEDRAEEIGSISVIAELEKQQQQQQQLITDIHMIHDIDTR